jgi:hypothetical protein
MKTFKEHRELDEALGGSMDMKKRLQAFKKLKSNQEVEIAYDSSFARNQKAKMGIIYALQKPGKPNKYMLVFLDKKNKIIRHVKTYSSENDAKKDMTVLEKKLREAEKHWAKHGDMRGFKA